MGLTYPAFYDRPPCWPGSTYVQAGQPVNDLVVNAAESSRKRGKAPIGLS
jgi:hypothetical protein